MNEVDKPQPETSSSENSSQLSRELEEIASATNSRSEKDPKPEENIDTDGGKSEKLTESINLAEWTSHIADNLGGRPVDGKMVYDLVVGNVRRMPKGDQRVALATGFAAVIGQPNIDAVLKQKLLDDLGKVSNGEDIRHLTG